MGLRVFPWVAEKFRLNCRGLNAVGGKAGANIGCELHVPIVAVLACIREQHKRKTSAYLRQVCDLDVRLESQLRERTDDQIPNEPVTIYPGAVGRLERAISYYADLVGTLAGICLLMSVIVVWIAIGPALHFSSNWWLIIGTYAGLIGMHDGFVLHNIQSQLNRQSQAALADVVKDDWEALAITSLVARRKSSVSSAGHERRSRPEIHQHICLRQQDQPT